MHMMPTGTSLFSHGPQLCSPRGQKKVLDPLRASTELPGMGLESLQRRCWSAAEPLQSSAVLNSPLSSWVMLFIPVTSVVIFLISNALFSTNKELSYIAVCWPFFCSTS